MAQININEVSQNYLWSVGTASFATVALPLTSSWGPGFVDPATLGDNKTDEDVLDTLAWQRFPSTQAGLESFIATYRGPASNYRLAGDYSFQMAQTLLAAGYDVLTCRLCPGLKAEGTFTVTAGGKLTLKAKYPGTFGNNLLCALRKVPNQSYYNLIVYVVDTSGTRSAVENLLFVFDIENSTDAILHVDEIQSNFVDLVVDGITSDNVVFSEQTIQLTGGTDKSDASDKDVAAIIKEAADLATIRYGSEAEDLQYLVELNKLSAISDKTKAETVLYKEWLYTKVINIYKLLEDRLSYSPQRIISPGWDDQNFSDLTGEVYSANITTISPIHKTLMETAYRSRCATALLDIPKSLPRKYVHNVSDQDNELGYAQRLARFAPDNSAFDVNAGLFASHSALQAPWGSYTYVGTSKKSPASPSFLVLMVQRAMVLNQAAQYEWVLPTKRTHTLDIGKFDYTVTKKQLDEWQNIEGVGVNILTNIPDLGSTLWGNSTLFEVPPATYQALANLSTRYLVNAVKDQVFRCGIQITFSYNNADAYSSFYAGVTPLLDNMKTVGAIEGYKIRMSSDISAEDRVNANTIIGKIWLQVNGVVNQIDVDLIALPPNASLETL